MRTHELFHPIPTSYVKDFFCQERLLSLVAVPLLEVNRAKTIEIPTFRGPINERKENYIC